MINWKVSKTDFPKLQAIADRAERLAVAQELAYDRMNILMDLTATHANGCPLRLSELLVASDFDFLHDILGIRCHLDRKTGKLNGCFQPRSWGGNV